LRAYREKRNAVRNIALRLEYDWSSHGADAFGLKAVAFRLIEGEREGAQKAQNAAQTEKAICRRFKDMYSALSAPRFIAVYCARRFLSLLGAEFCFYFSLYRFRLRLVRSKWDAR